MKIFINDAKLIVEDHKKNLQEENIFYIKLQVKLIAITEYLVVLNQRVDLNYCITKRENKVKILENLHGFCYIILSLPLLEILRPSFIEWIQSLLMKHHVLHQADIKPKTNGLPVRSLHY